jgi:hypothetical protein
MNAKTQETVTIKPAAGLRVRKPNGQLLANEGEAVTWNSYWLRREKDGDIERVTEKPARAPRTAKAATSTDPQE